MLPAEDVVRELVAERSVTDVTAWGGGMAPGTARGRGAEPGVGLEIDGAAAPLEEIEQHKDSSHVPRVMECSVPAGEALIIGCQREGRDYKKDRRERELIGRRGNRLRRESK